MQTFLPYPDFAASAAVLDRARLGKQRVECLQILNALTLPGRGWANHPAVRMWRGHEEALAAYGLAVCGAWCARGYRDTCASKLAVALSERLDIAEVRAQAELAAAGDLPGWLGDEAFHRSHRAVLVAKDPGHYGPIFGDVQDADVDAGVRWPVPA